MSNPTKKCNKCKEIKELIEFHKTSKFKDGLNNICKNCHEKWKIEYESLPFDIPNPMRTCGKCKIEKSTSEFTKNSSSRDGLSYNCKDCTRKQCKDYRNSPPNTPEIIRTCRACCVDKNFIEFSKSNCTVDGLRYICKDCDKINNLKKYDLTIDDYDSMMLVQYSKCAICNKTESENDLNRITGKPTKLSVDHCHKTGKIRGLLCNPCNRGLGAFFDDPERLEKAALYLRGLLK